MKSEIDGPVARDRSRGIRPSKTVSRGVTAAAALLTVGLGVVLLRLPFGMPKIAAAAAVGYLLGLIARQAGVGSD